MDDVMLLLAVVVALTLVFDFINGFHDSANAIATVVSTRVLSPLVAVVYAGILNFIGALLGTEVAATIGSGLVDTATVTLHTILCTVVAAIIWNLITWYKGLPTSSSHAIIGSLLGAAYFSSTSGHDNIHLDKLLVKVIYPMFTSPVLGVVLGFVLMGTLVWLIYRLSPARVNRLFGRLQIVSAGFMAITHGLNDAQKSMGIIALALLTVAPQEAFVVPLWVKIACALAMGAGTMMGGWRIIHTLGSKMIKLQPAQGFAAETTAALIIGGASHFGIPVSTTQVITTSIMGVGAQKRLSAVRWGIVGNIIWAWVLTIPTTFLLAGGLTFLYRTLWLS
ncbi:MAG: inorganic phosphate transporter [Alphaproteobacteria bacterium]|nr:inorganic phosphate transporter [Alphaproteobacteria bacterium]